MSERDEHSPEIKVTDRRHWAGGSHDAQASTDDDAAPPSATPSTPSDGDGGTQTLAFQAETRQLLDLMIHSLYSDKEIFLRELISNASDALDALRFAAVTEPELIGDGELCIRLSTDSESRTLSISDNGIGMSRAEVVDNIGTIAKSGTRELLQRIKANSSGGEQPDAIKLIGQFGVGFYSAFMVAHRVELLTRRAGESRATRWRSGGDGTYTISDDERDEAGTTITLHLKPVDAEHGLPDFTDRWVIERVVKKYSDFIRYPIKLAVRREEQPSDDEGNVIEDAEKVTVVEDKTLNSMKAIWKRRHSDVSQDEYAEFYRQISHDFEPPLETVALQAEGRLEYQALLFLPKRAPFDVYYQGAESGLQLYVNSVRIMERCEALLPHYLRFVRGVVESSDLPLNVSREMLQNDRQIAQIQRGLVKKLLDTLATLLDGRRDEYEAFWRELGRALKEGLAGDQENKDKLLPLLLFETSQKTDSLTTLAEYIERMGDEQDAIYYLTAESRQIAARSPHLEAFADRGYEVLFLVDPVDELMMQSLREYEGKPLKSIGKGEVELGSESERKESAEAREEQRKQAAGLLELLQKKLDEHVKQVRLSSRLTSSPACLVGAEHDLSPHIERLLARSGSAARKQKRILELNAEHAIFAAMKARYDSDADDALLGDYAELLFGQALLAEGSELPDPPAFARLVSELMVRAS